MRKSGILMHITSLSSPYGIGTLGRETFRFVDFLKSAGQGVWQILPLGQTGFGDSPYQTFSAFAGNEYLIDLDLLIEEGLLLPGEVRAADFGCNAHRVDYGRLYGNRLPVLKKAYGRFVAAGGDLEAFASGHSGWIYDYALFRALKASNGGRPWWEWDGALRSYPPAPCAASRQETGFYIFLQYLFFTQWERLRAYAKKNGIKIIGDLPIYVSTDSAEVWAHREYFQLGENGLPSLCAGVPPDYFSENGQLWGNPLYDWAHLEKTGYGLWMQRLQLASEMFGCVRLDHFRGLENYWAVPAFDTTAKNGRWLKGPGIGLVKEIRRRFPKLDIIAEDLGDLDDAAQALREKSGWPGMAVLQFAFDAGGKSAYLPHRIGENCVCYTGTHDNATLYEWAQGLPPGDMRFAKRYLGARGKADLPGAVIKSGMESRAVLFISQMQDWLGAEAFRMNTPGTLGGNWQWRIKAEQLDDKLAGRLYRMTRESGRL